MHQAIKVKISLNTYNSIGDLQHLFEERVGLHVTTAGVHNDDLELLRLELVNTLGCDHDRVDLGVAAVEGNARLGRVLLQLIIRAGTVRVRAHQTRLPASLLVVVGQLEKKRIIINKCIFCLERREHLMKCSLLLYTLSFYRSPADRRT